MPETAQQYTQRMLDLSQGKDPLRLQRAAPGKLAALTKKLSKKQLALRPAPGKWSIAEILAHMADAELVISYRIRLVLSTDGAAIQAYDQNAWAETFDYNHCVPKISLETFRALREINLRLLNSVPRRLWKNYGQHSERGKESVEHIVRMVAGHDLNHILQIEKIVKKFS
jgi:uncharacterized damage-inducible protein DinB